MLMVYIYLHLPYELTIHVGTIYKSSHGWDIGFLVHEVFLGPGVSYGDVLDQKSRFESQGWNPNHQGTSLRFGREMEPLISRKYLVGGFKYFLLSPLFGEDSHFDKYFSDGLKPPTSIGWWKWSRTAEFGIQQLLRRSWLVGFWEM